MAACFIASYDITDADTYARYNPGSLEVIIETIEKHGGKVLAAGPNNEWIADKRTMVVMLEFPSVETAKAWESDPDYAPARQFRHDSTGARFEVIAPEFVPPSG